MVFCRRGGGAAPYDFLQHRGIPKIHVGKANISALDVAPLVWVTLSLLYHGAYYFVDCHTIIINFISFQRHLGLESLINYLKTRRLATKRKRKH